MVIPKQKSIRGTVGTVTIAGTGTRAVVTPILHLIISRFVKIMVCSNVMLNSSRQIACKPQEPEALLHTPATHPVNPDQLTILLDNMGIVLRANTGINPKDLHDPLLPWLEVGNLQILGQEKMLLANLTPALVPLRKSAQKYPVHVLRDSGMAVPLILDSLHKDLLKEHAENRLAALPAC